MKFEPNLISPYFYWTVSILTSGIPLSAAPDLTVPGCVGPSTVLPFVLGRLLLSGLFCSIVNTGVAVVELMSSGMARVAVDGVMFVLALYDDEGSEGPVEISFSIAVICLP